MIPRTLIRNQTEYQKKVFALNQQRILRDLSLSILDYNLLIYETGMSFLELFYDANIPSQQEWIVKFSQIPEYEFWKFWKAEWKMREHQFLLHLKLNRKEINKNDWKELHYEATHDGFLEQSFRNFQKFLDCGV